MATSIDTTRLSGYFKVRFGEDGSMLPDPKGYDKLQKAIKFSEPRLGEKITEPVRVSHSTGWTFAGGATTGTVWALNDANSPQTVEATWTSVEFAIREKISWAAMRRAQTSAQAFGNAFDSMVMDMRLSAKFALEANLVYGASDFGTIESQTGSGTNRVWTLSTATGAAGLWYKMNGALLDVYSAYGGTKHNGNADVVLVGVDINATSGKVELTVTGNSTDLSDIDTDLQTAAVIIPKGADSNMMVGLDAIASVPTSYAGITSADHPMFTSSSQNASSAALTYAKVMAALRKNMVKSGSGQRAVLCSPETMTDIGNSATTLQRLDKGGGRAELGHDSVTFTGPLGSVEFMWSPVIKPGEAFLCDLGEMERVGSIDFTFDPTGKGDYFEPISGYAGHEVVGYWDQTLKVSAPNTITKITGIVNTF